jgi:hypothetical protein
MGIFALTATYELRVSRKSHLRDHPSYYEILRGREEAIFAVLANGTRRGAINNDRNKKGNLLYYYSTTVCTAPTVLNLNS